MPRFERREKQTKFKADVLMDYFTPARTTENVEGMDLETIDDEYSS